jgi:hypothetical protein
MGRGWGAVAGAVAGLLFTTMGLVDLDAGFDIGGGNEATPFVIAGGIAVGALLGATVLRQWVAVIVGLAAGLVAGMWLRDNAGMYPVQPPWVFVLLFGLPLLGATVGYLWQRRIEG